MPASSPGLLVGNPPPRWGAPGDDLAVVGDRHGKSGFTRRIDMTLRRRYHPSAGMGAAHAKTPSAVLVDVRTEARVEIRRHPRHHAPSDGRPLLIEWVDCPPARATTSSSTSSKEARRSPRRARRWCSCVAPVSVPSARRRLATAAGIGPSYNVLDGFEGGPDANGHRGGTGWRAHGLPWRQS